MFNDDFYNTPKNDYWKEALPKYFPELKDTLVLSTIKYINERPYKFFDKNTYFDYFNFLTDLKKHNLRNLKHILKHNLRDINIALKHLQTISILEIHDTPLPDDQSEYILQIDQLINPNYLKLIESIFSNLIKPIAYEYLLSINKNTDSLTNIFNIVEAIKKTKYEYLSTVYIHTIRNGIAHGDITYKEHEVIFKDLRNNTKEIQYHEYINIFDQLLDYCNAMSLALTNFYLLHNDFLQKHKIEVPPAILEEEFKCRCNNYYWSINTILETRQLQSQKQLSIYINNELLDYNKVQFYTLRTAIFLEQYTSNYHRFAFHLKNKWSKYIG